MDLGGSWESFLPLIEFAYNNSFQATIVMILYEALHDRRSRSPIHQNKVGKNRILDPKIIAKTIQIVDKIRDGIKSALDRQKSYIEQKRKLVEFEVGEKIFIKIALAKGV